MSDASRKIALFSFLGDPFEEMVGPIAQYLGESTLTWLAFDWCKDNEDDEEEGPIVIRSRLEGHS